MKRTLALLIAVLMVVAMLPISILTVGAEEPVPLSADMFAVYDDAQALVGNYATLAEADAALANGYTLKLLHSYNATEPYTWGAARTGDDLGISFTIDGNGNGIAYEGAGSIWSFAADCADDQIVLRNIQMMSTAGADILTVSDGACLIIENGMYMSNGRAVVRTVKGASADTPATLIIWGGDFMLNPSDAVQANDAVVTNGDAGNVYIYGGIFVNNNDAVVGDTRSNYVVNQTNAAGDFHIYGGVMMATAAQKGFFVPANSGDTEGSALPMKEISIIKGMTSKYEFNGREYYYTSYGVGFGTDSSMLSTGALLAPVLSPVARAEVLLSQDGESVESVNLVFVSNVSADLYAAIDTWANSIALNAAHTVSFGTLIVTEEEFVTAKGNVQVLLSNGATPVVATAADIVEKNGNREILARKTNVAVADKNARFVAIPFIDLSVDGAAAQRWYGEFNLTTGVASMAVVAANALRDNTAAATDVYQYPSILTPENGTATVFNRYPVQAQQALMDYLAHEHDYGYNGACRVEGCDKTVCEDLNEGEAPVFYAEDGSVSCFKLVLKAGVNYRLGFSNDIASYQLYNEAGSLCTVANNTFTVEADGNYYLRVDGKKTGNSQVAFAHMHNVDHLGQCSVCTHNVAIPVTVGADLSTVVVKGNAYVFKVDLKKGVNYSLRAANGSIELYDAAGTKQTVTNNVYVCAADATYYIKMQATYTGTAIVQVVHNHMYDASGYCAYCQEYLGVQLNNVYEYSEEQRVEPGDQLFFNIRLEEGKTYKIVPNRYVGVFKVYSKTIVEEAPVYTEIALVGGATFQCPADGVYYLVVDVQTKTFAQISFEVEHECTYNNKGECVFEHVTHTLGENDATVKASVTCGKTDRVRIEDGLTKNATLKAGTKSRFFMSYAAAGVTYKISIKGAVNYTFYDEDENVMNDYTVLTVDDITEITYRSAEDTNVYLVLENVTEETVSASVAVAHVHTIGHRGQCTVMITTSGKAPYACTEKSVENMKPDEALTVSFQSGDVKHFAISLKKDVHYTVALSDATWKIVNVDNVELVFDDAKQAYVPEATGVYYIIVTATADSAEGAQLLVRSHTHSYGNKGECECGDKLSTRVDIEVGRRYEGFLATGTHYFKVEMLANNTYTISFSNLTGVSYKLYGGASADQEITLTEGAFTCTEAGVYYLVVTVTQDTPAREEYQIVAAPVAGA